MPKTLTDEQVTHFREDGYLVVPNLLSTEEVTQTRDGFTRLVREADEKGKHPTGLHIDFERAFDTSGKTAEQRELGLRKLQSFAERDAFFWSQVTHPRIVALLNDVLGPGAQMLQSMALVKPPEIGIAKQWHQDVAYFDVEPKEEVLGLWIAIDDATLDNGCMEVVPGSHKLGLVQHVQGQTGWKLPDSTVELYRDRIVKLPMKAGSALLFSSLAFHFTDHNRSKQRRRALQYHYVSARTHPTATGGWLKLWPLNLPHPPLAPAMAGR
ncbi:MAG: phytanoyl-CoA dioxygenase family protein [Planctomycetes bacterium]|nr:phytanoyl-CoA dioxygenase family protein [Planctomycetota bacterium]